MNPVGLACRSVFSRATYNEERGEGEGGGNEEELRTVEHENFKRREVGFERFCHCS